MIRTAVLALAVSLVLSCSALAAESAYWVPEANSPAKAIDIIAHTSGDGTIRAMTHDSKVYKRAAGTAGAWALDWTIATGSAVNPGNNNCSWRLYNKTAVWPQLVSFGGALYASRLYMTVREGPGGSCTNYMYPECRVIKWDGAVETPVLQLGGSPSTAWQCGAVFNFYNPVSDSISVGYLFQSGVTLYWAGGGAKRIDPVALPAGLAANIDWTKYGPDFRYVYSSADGTAWNLVNRTLGNDEYGRPIAAAMPDGYRYNHILNFNGTLFDYYGYYNAGTLAFTPHPAGSPQTEPWGWFLMGQDGINIYRVAHNKKGDKNFVYQTNAPGAAWGKVAAGVLPNDGSVYWRGCAAVSAAQQAATVPPGNAKHAGLYCTYSAGTGLGTWESGVYRYSDPTGGGSPSWSKVTYHATDARVYTGGIFIKPGDGIYVGTSTGVIRRGIGTRTVVDPGPPPVIENPDPDEP